MNTLKNNNLTLNFVIAYVGLDKNFVSVEDVLRDLDIKELEKLDEKELLLLYSSDSNPEKFKEILNEISNITEEKYTTGLKIWEFSFLKDICQNKMGISEKLKNIANLWPIFNYTENWKFFINYMPVKEGSEVGEEFLYSVFLNYMENESSKKDAYYKLIC